MCMWILDFSLGKWNRKFSCTTRIMFCIGVDQQFKLSQNFYLPKSDDTCGQIKTSMATIHRNLTYHSTDRFIRTASW